MGSLILIAETRPRGKGGTTVDTDIESFDRMQLRNLRAYLLFFSHFVILMLVRFFFRASGLNETPIGIAVLIGLIVSAIGQAMFVLLQARTAVKINKDPHLKAAFSSELLQHLEAQAWKGAYVGAAGTVLFFAVVSSFYPVCDPLMIALTTIAVGAGAQRATFYFKYRSS